MNFLLFNEFLKDKQKVLKFIILLGIVSLFEDITYKGAKVLLAFFTLGVSATVVVSQQVLVNLLAMD